MSVFLIFVFGQQTLANFFILIVSVCILQELVDCLACLKPLKIIPTVSVSKSDDQVKLLLNTLKGKNM